MIKPPVAEKIPKELTIHDHTRIDDYFWMNQREDAKVIEHLTAENEYTRQLLKHTEPLQEELYNEMVSRIKQDDSSVPYKDNGYFYYVRYVEGKEYPIYCRKKDSLDSDEELMLNVNEMAEGNNYFNVAGVSISQDNRLASYGVDKVGRRIYDIYFKDLKTGEILKDKLSNTTGSACWCNDNKTLFYSIKDEALRSFKIFRHQLGTEQASDVEIYHEEDETFHVIAYKSKSDQYIFIASFSSVSTEYKFLDANDPLGIFTTLQPRMKEVEYYVNHYKEKFYIRTNLNAKNFRLVTTPVTDTLVDNWVDMIPHNPNILLQEEEIFTDFMAVQERMNGLTQIRIINLETSEDHYLDFGEAAYTAGIGRNPEFNTDILRYNYSSLTTPGSVFDYNMKTREKILLKQDEVLGDFNKDNYFSERLFASAEDGALIPISLVYRKGIKRDGKNPMLLYAYGSYGITTEPGFSSSRLSLIDRGFIWAIAHIRGGEDLGRYWYEEGKLLKKKNTFTDFIACAEYLINEKFTSSEKLSILGGSAGGLLIGTVINMRPDLFKAAVAAVPFVDVVTTMLDDSIPLTTGEYNEWGNPNEKEYYDYILSYSPYDNIERKNYPTLLVTTGLHDSQVQYWEPAKWVAKLREYKTNDNPILLHTNMEAGHGGASGRFKRLKETALEFAFLIDRVINN